MSMLGLYEKAAPGALSWDERLTAARDAGFDYLEISVDESDARLSRLDWTQAQFDDLVAASRASGVPIRSMCLSAQRKYPFGSLDPAIRARSMDIFRRAVLFCARAGVRLIQLAGYDVYYEEGNADTRAYFADGLREAVAFAAENEVCLGFETMETPFMDTVSKGMTYVRDMQSAYLGMYPDLGNLTNACELYGLSVTDELAAARGRLFALHVKETVPGVYRDMRFGEGRVDFETAVRAAKNLGVGCFTAEFWHDGRENWREGLRAASDFLRRYV